jgi:hypothetical protein
MRRRTLLSAVALAAGVGGCLGDTPPTAGDDPDDAPPTTDDDGGSAGGDTHPRFTETSLTSTRRCDNPGTATVAFDDDGVTITGCARGRNGCAVPVLADVSYRVAADLVTVVVASDVERRGDVGCTEALKPLGYETRVVMDGMVPGHVAVIHDDVDGRRTVVRTSRPET